MQIHFELIRTKGLFKTGINLIFALQQIENIILNWTLKDWSWRQFKHFMCLNSETNINLSKFYNDLRLIKVSIPLLQHYAVYSLFFFYIILPVISLIIKNKGEALKCKYKSWVTWITFI